MTIFLILGITILILITIVIVQSSKKEKSTSQPPTTDPPTTQPPACTKYKYNSSCLDTCGDKFVDETEKKCYDSVPDGKYADGKNLLDNCGNKYVNETEKKCYDEIPTGKYADGKTLLDNCGESETNKIVKGNICVSSCDEFTYEPQDKTLNLYGECKSTCDNYYIQSVFEKLCLNANLINALFKFDNVKITDDFSKFIIDEKIYPNNPPNIRVFYQGNNQKELRKSVVNSPGLIDLKMSSSGTVYARVYKNKIEILIQDLFNQPSTLPKYTINVPQNFSQLNSTLGYEIEDFNFCGKDGVLGTLTQAIIILKSTVPQNGALKKEVYVVIIRDNDFSLFPVQSLNYYDSYILNVYKPSYLGIIFTSSTLREDMFSLCYSTKSDNYIDLVYLQFIISNKNNDSQVYYTKNERIIQKYSFNGTFIGTFINAKSTKHIVALLSDKNNTNTYDIDIYNLNDDYKIQESPSPNITPNVVSNIAVGCTITNNTTTPAQSKEIAYYVSREPNSSDLKLFKYKYIKTQTVTSLPDPNITIPPEVVYVFPVSSSNACAYLNSNSDGSILAIGIHDGNTNNLYKYNEVSNTVEKIF